jgi:hypothetical protein
VGAAKVLFTASGVEPSHAGGEVWVETTTPLRTSWGDNPFAG